jgi:hypothetical protein
MSASGRKRSCRCFHRKSGFSVPAAQEINQRVRWQVFDRMLNSRSSYGIRQAAVMDHAVGGQPHRSGRRHDTGAPVAEYVAIRRDRHRRPGGEMIGQMMSDARVKCVPKSVRIKGIDRLLAPGAVVSTGRRSRHVAKLPTVEVVQVSDEPRRRISGRAHRGPT